MRVYLHKNFAKQFKKLSKQEQALIQAKIELFILDQFHPQLRNHPFKGKYVGCRSIDIRPDLRAVYYLDIDTAVFNDLGSHSQLYQ